MSAPLEDLRVIDLTTTTAGATCTMLLADFGAEVLQLFDGGAERQHEPHSVALGRGKVRVGIDRGDHEQVRELLASADVIVTAIAEDEIVDADVVSELAAANPGLVVMRMPAFASVAGPGGVESAGMLGAALGLGLRQYSTAGVPVDYVTPYVLYTQGAWAAICVVAALIERQGSGSGQEVVVGGEHGAMIAAFATYGYDAAQPILPPPGPGGPNPLYSRYRCGDGEWIFLGALTRKFQRIALETLGIADLLDDPRIAGRLEAIGTGENRGWVRERCEEAFKNKSASEWLTTLREADCPVGEMLYRDDWLDHPQIRAIGMHAEFDDPEVGRVSTPGVPLVLDTTPARPPAAPTTVSASEIDVARDVRAAPTAQPTGEPGSGPLAGLHALDLGVVLAGPLAGNLLAELGADVVKIEPPTGDPFRDQGFHYNRGMRSLSIDLRDEGGYQAFVDLVRHTDVVIDNFRAGVLERLRIDHATLVAANPDVTSVSITGFGTTGPLQDVPGFDPVLGAMSGMMHAQGGSDEPVMLALAINDVTAGLMAAFGSCVAIYARRAGVAAGQRASTSLAAASTFAQMGELVRFPGRPAPEVGSADHLGSSPLSRSYRTADGWVRIEAEATAVTRLVEAGLVDGPEPDQLADGLEKALLELGSAEAVEQLAELRVPAVVARLMAQATVDQRLLDDELFHALAKDDGGPMMLPGRLVSYSRTGCSRILGPPGLGEHSRAVLAEAGVPDDQIQDLIETGVVVESGPMSLTGIPGYR